MKQDIPLPKPPAFPPYFPPGSDAIAAHIALEHKHHKAGRLRLDGLSFFLPANSTQSAKKPKGVVLAFHGLTAAPYQFWQIGAAWAAMGLHVFALRLPGHGEQPQEGLGEDYGLPTSNEAHRYIEACDAALDAAHALAQEAGVPLYLSGLSAGAALALHRIAARPQILAGALLFSAFLAPRPVWAHAALALARYRPLQRVCGALLDRLPHGWPIEFPDPKQSGANPWRRPPPNRFRKGHILAIYGLAQDAQAHLQAQSSTRLPPLAFFMSGADDKSALVPVRRLHRRLGGALSGHFLQQWPADLGIPHSMLSSMEHTNPKTQAQVHAAVHSWLRAQLGILA